MVITVLWHGSFAHSLYCLVYAEYHPKNGINWIWYYSSSSSSESEMFLCFNNKSTEICCMFYVMRSDSSKLNSIQSEKQTQREKIRTHTTPRHIDWMIYGLWRMKWNIYHVAVFIYPNWMWIGIYVHNHKNHWQFQLYACIDNKNQRLLWLILLVYCTANLFGAEKKQANNVIPIQ